MFSIRSVIVVCVLFFLVQKLLLSEVIFRSLDDYLINIPNITKLLDITAFYRYCFNLF